MPVPLPGDFTLHLAPDVRRPRPGVLIGGAPVRVLRLTAAGAALVDGWAVGRPVGPSRAARTLAARLVEAGIAWPSPPPAAGRLAVSACVVIPVRDDPAGLEATLAGLRATAPQVPVVVVDDGSEPPVTLAGEGAAGEAAAGEGAAGVAAAGVGRPMPGEAAAGKAAAGKAAVVRRPMPGGPAAARNTGVGHVPSHTDVIVFIDAGCVPDDGWLETLLAAFADPGLAAVAPRVRSRALAGTPSALARYETAHSPLDLGPTPGPVRPWARVSYVPSAVLAVRSEALRQAGGFDEDLRFGEDVDLVWRLHDQGWRLRYEPSATATHPCRPGLRSWLRQRFDYGRSATPLAHRHGRKVAPLTVSPWSVAVWSLLALGRPMPAVALAAGSAQSLARRAGGDAPVAAELRRLAAGGTIRAAGPIGAAIRRAWLPPAVSGWAVGWVLSSCMRPLMDGRVGFGNPSGRRTRRASLVLAALAVSAGPGLSDWWRQRDVRPSLPAASWVALRLADDLAYQAGVWSGVVGGRSVEALFPRW